MSDLHSNALTIFHGGWAKCSTLVEHLALWVTYSATSSNMTILHRESSCPSCCWTFFNLNVRITVLVSERASPKEPGAPPKMTKYSMVYPPLRDALKHTWKGLTRKQTKELNPAVVFSILCKLLSPPHV
jgi:hypothetical protein